MCDVPVCVKGMFCTVALREVAVCVTGLLVMVLCERAVCVTGRLVTVFVKVQCV